MKLLVKYAIELKDELQGGLADTPTQPWKDIIPQLFCRLNHPEGYVRQSISELLCRIAHDFPHLIIYPAVVGSQDGPTRIENVNTANDSKLFETEGVVKSQSTNKADLDEVEEMSSNEASANDENKQQEANTEVRADDEEDEEESVKEEKKSELKNSYKYLLDTLAQANPMMTEQVKLFVHELRRITLLREELWFGTLNQIRMNLIHFMTFSFKLPFQLQFQVSYPFNFVFVKVKFQSHNFRIPYL